MNSAHAWATASAAIDRLPAPDRTVGAKIVAARFVERCAVAAAGADWSSLASWVDDACDRYAGIMPAQDVFAAAIDGVAQAFAGTAGASNQRGFATARAEIEAVLARPRAAAAAPMHEAIDEVDVALDGLLTKLDQTDVLTAEHSRAVASWCARLGKRLALPKAEILHLTRAGLVHDIGKVTTPLAILNAPRRLDGAEMAIMRDHARAGAAMAEEIPLIAPFIPAVRNHHERFDGTGYPDGLKWEAIPRVARIVSVADAFNAMIGRRPYRPPMAPSLALEQLVEGRGTQFDPDVVDAMIDVVTNRA
jgi:putative nucleotidyltransferase with HDIG domain